MLRLHRIKQSISSGWSSDTNHNHPFSIFLLWLIAKHQQHQQRIYKTKNKYTEHRKYTVQVTTTQLKFGYSAECACCTVDRSKILTVKAIDKISACCEWGGYGIRKQFPAWETGYLPKSGSGIRVTLKDAQDKEKAYTFICDGAKQVADLLTA